MNIKTEDDIKKYILKRQKELNDNYFNMNRSDKNAINSIIKNELKKYIPKNIGIYKKYNGSIEEFIKQKILNSKGGFTSERNNYIYFLKNNYLKEYKYIIHITNFLPDDVNFTVRLIYVLEGLKEIKKCSFCGKEIMNTRMNCSINCKKRRGNDKPETVRKNKVIPDTNKTLYEKECRRLTEINYKQNIKCINPNNYNRGRAGTKGSYHLDHIISVDYGYKNGISPEVISDVGNLQMLKWEDNCKKNKYLDKHIKIRLNQILLDEVSEKSVGVSLTFLITELLKEFNKNKNLNKKIINKFDNTY